MLNLVKKAASLPLQHRYRCLAKAFLLGTKRAPETQRQRLLELVERNQQSTFGRDHHFEEIKTPADFRRRVPIRDYEGHEPYIAKVREGQIDALFGPGTEVLMFAKTSGTTDKPKTIPVTRESLASYRNGWTIWGIRAFDDHPAILSRGLKPILQMASDWRESLTPAGIPCGAITGLTSHMQSPLIRMNYCMPPATMRIRHIEAKYYVALRLSAYRQVGATIAANPSTILAIARLGDREKETLIRDLADGTIDRKWEIPDDVRSDLQFRVRWKRRSVARRFEAIVHRTGRLLPKDYWPGLDFLANWTGGTMSAYLRQYPEYFGDRPVRDIGLIASEGRMTIPISDQTAAGVLDYQHSYFEFIPEDQIDRDQPETLEAADLIEGRRYFILLTTSSGLYRYQIHDLVKCTAFEGKAPLLEFLNKGAHFSSMTGEKLSEFQVVSAVNKAQQVVGMPLTGFLLLPTWSDPPYYSLLVDQDDMPDLDSMARLELEVEAQVQRINLEYENRRATLRLAPIRIHRLARGCWPEFQRRRLSQSGGTVEQYKQPCLLPDLNAIDSFAFVDQNPRGPTRSVEELTG